MLLALLADLEAPSWQTWVIPAAGLGAALLTLTVGRFVLSHRRARTAASPPPSDADAGDGGPAYDPFENGSIREQRQGVRRKGNPIEALITDAEATEEPIHGWVTDRSTNGLCLLLHDEIAVGTQISVKPRLAPPTMPWVKATVRNCKREKDGYVAGCQFVTTPPWGILLLFG
jgi:hypothetical protein